MRALRIPFLVLLLAVISVPAEGQGIWRKFVDWVREGNEFDSSYIYQRPARFQIDLDGSLRRVSVDLQADYTATCRETDDEGNVTATAQVPAQVVSTMSENINGGLGVGVNYGKLGLGVGIGTWPANAPTTSSLTLGYQGHKWGIGLGYYNFSQNVSHSLTIDTSGATQWHSVSESQSVNPCRVGRLTVDAYWTLGRSRFAYTAAYKCDMLQRQSKGSAMICAGMVFSGMEHNEGDALLMLSQFSGYYCLQGSVGAGYSHNFVFRHRDPSGPKEKGLSNITLNLTILPMLTFFNRLEAIPLNGGDRVTIAGQASPSATGSAALGLTFGRLFVSLQYRHNLFYYHTADTMSAAELGLTGGDIDDVSVSGLFNDWRVTGIVVFNF